MQSGVTLVELMVTVTIGIIVLAGLIQVFISNQSSYNLQTKMGDLQENGRFGLFFLQRDIRMAGYPKNDNASPALLAFVTSGGDDTSRTVDGSALSGGGATASDRLAVQYRTPSANFVACDGTIIATKNTLLTAVYSITTDTSVTPNTHQLSCKSCVNNACAAGTASGGKLTSNGQPLLTGIENMQIQFGVDNDTGNVDAAGYGYADYYTRADQVPASKWSGVGVVSVRVALLSSTIDPITDEDASSQAKSFTVLDASGIKAGTCTADVCGSLSGVTGKKVRGRVFTTTIEVRNRSSGI